MIDVFENEETNDFIRLSTLELCARELSDKKTPGAMAEVGVYRGIFAAQMNRLFPSKSLFLFDTFEGFDPKQEDSDKQNHGLNHRRDFSDTTVKMVMSRMLSPTNCIVKKGLFPATARGLSEKFCLVSLDADLFEPTLDGLQWFWPRLEQGGYILVHDYNNSKFPGARSAVVKFSTENHIPFVPVTDPYGTAIFAK